PSPRPATASFPLSLHDALPICCELEATLERFQPRIGDAHTTEWCVRLPVLALAVPIRPSRDAESQPLGDAHQPLLDGGCVTGVRSEEHTSELQSRGHLVCRLLL